jgi:hypothetical protein
MNFSLLRVLLWGLAYLLLLEGVLEIRAHSRGFDTIALGSFQRQNVAKTDTPLPPTTTLAALPSDAPEKDNRRNALLDCLILPCGRQLPEPRHNLSLPLGSITQEDPAQRSTVINASHAGMDIEANRGDLESRGAREKPDVVILYQMSTQITKLSKQLLSGKQPRSSKKKESDSPKPTPQPSWIAQGYEHTSLYALLKGNISNRLTGQRVLADSLGEPADRVFETQVKEFVHSARKVGAEPVLCTFATSHTKKNLPDVPGEVTDFLFRYNVYLSLSGWFETITRFNQTLKRVADEEHIRLVDLDLVVSGHPEYFRDFVHFTPEGHQKVAETIYAGLQTELPQRFASETSNAH